MSNIVYVSRLWPPCIFDQTVNPHKSPKSWINTWTDRHFHKKENSAVQEELLLKAWWKDFKKQLTKLSWEYAIRDEYKY